MQIDTSIVNKLIDDQITITGAESLTAGMFQSTIGGVPGVSAIFYGGFVTYSNEAKAKLLSISMDVIDEYGVVSEQVAIWMAKQSKQIMNVDVGVSFTGVAGPDSLEGQPAGTVFIGLDFKGNQFAKEFHFSGSRQEVREQSVQAALKMIENEYSK
ncbi:Putative competence-damage inducible protein [Apilactobacillus kunkeei]|nr:Putative competence-damage inducible protein [Apilactobacillus kunkeei]CAI2585536.1 Putative competence-damage inducible protein [Apilactobacillus kunkeei]CAI2585555.1 Putative competence-damage inducible protein [Apilactobacillus kunkeei]CAI2659167.1 Putative competence-damage inducible protein [Apilactobacillus kunkeei]